MMAHLELSCSIGATFSLDGNTDAKVDEVFRLYSFNPFHRNNLNL